MLGVYTVLDQDDLDLLLNDYEKDFIMQGQGYALSVSHSAAEEKADQFVRPFKRYGWEFAGAYCPQSSIGSVADLLMAEKVDAAFVKLQEKLVSSGLEPISADKVNCIAIEANLNQSGSFPKEGWLAGNLLAIHIKYPEAKLMLYTSTDNFEINYFGEERKKLGVSFKALAAPDENTDLILSKIQYFPKGPIMGELLAEARKRPKPGMMSPSNSSSLGSPVSHRSSPYSSPVSAGFSPVKFHGSAGTPQNALADSGSFVTKVTASRSIHPGMVEFSEGGSADPSTPKSQSRPKQDRSPLREVLGEGSPYRGLKVTTPERRGPAAIMLGQSRSIKPLELLGLPAEGAARSPADLSVPKAVNSSCCFYIVRSQSLSGPHNICSAPVK
ncbi:MAG: hypothetical protein K0Q57_805 [Gammaproteobacteria bacterium]|nr:hypothetical protein [Gammaproteobacteria bacterium]